MKKTFLLFAIFLTLTSRVFCGLTDDGDAKKSKGDLDGAIGDYTKAIELNPNDDYAYFRRGSAKYAKHDWDGAIADITKALELKPDDAFAYHTRGNAEESKGDWDKAIADYSK